MMMRIAPGAALTLALAMAGCSTMNIGGLGRRNAAPPPAPLVAAPAGSVSAAPLPPPGGVYAPGTSDAGVPPSGLATLAPGVRPGFDPSGGVSGAPPSGVAQAAAGVTRTDLIGSWTISAAGDTCQLNMVLTTWTGGYRASTRNCTSVALKGVSAWNLEGQQIQLFDGSGATVARLFATSKTQFNGSTNGGGPVSVYR